MMDISLPKLADTLPAVVPDASDWSIEDVVKFFKDVGFVHQAEVFREQVCRIAMIIVNFPFCCVACRFHCYVM